MSTCFYYQLCDATIFCFFTLHVHLFYDGEKLRFLAQNVQEKVEQSYI